MTDIADLEIVGYADWIDLKIGDKAIVKGKVTGARPGSQIIGIQDDAWNTTAITISDSEGFMGNIPMGTLVSVTIERTEDGLMTASEDVNINP